MTLGLSLREASPEDAALLDRITKAAFEEYRGRLEPPSGAHAETVAAVEAFLREHAAVIAEVDGAAVGAARLQRRDDESLYLSRLAVLPERRGQGIGRALVREVEEKARRLGIGRLTLGVRLQLPGNRAFFEARGFHAVRQHCHPGHERPTWIEMAKAVPR